MTLVFDTSVLIDHLRGHEHARRALSNAWASERGPAASVLTKVELLAGMRPAERSATGELTDAIDWIDVDEELAEHAGALASQYMRSHPGIELADYVIAATVERLGAELLTRNRKHFPEEPLAERGVRVMDPDDYLCELTHEVPDEVAATVVRLAAEKQRPPKTPADLLDSLQHAGVPRFSDKVRVLLAEESG